MLGLLSKVYGSLVKVRNKLYDSGRLKVEGFDSIEVVCIGNITVGGTGKTPAVQYFAKKYINQGKKVGIVSRGYKGERKQDPLLVRDYDEIKVEAKESGDESYLHALELDIPIAVGRSRYEACKLLLDSYDLDLIILDDGFQHRKLKRDKNIILIDATNPFGSYAMLPKGRLREPLDGLCRSDEFIITKSDLVAREKVEEIKEELKKYKKPISTAVHGPVKLYNKDKDIGLDEIKDKRILAFSALANPKQFEDTIAKFQPKSIKNLGYPDHYYYKDSDFEEIERIADEVEAELIISTEKDRVKYHSRFNSDKLYTLKIEFEIVEN